MGNGKPEEIQRLRLRSAGFLFVFKMAAIGDLVQWLRPLAPLAENPHFIPNIHLHDAQTIQTSFMLVKFSI